MTESSSDAAAHFNRRFLLRAVALSAFCLGVERNHAASLGDKGSGMWLNDEHALRCQRIFEVCRCTPGLHVGHSCPLQVGDQPIQLAGESLRCHVIVGAASEMRGQTQFRRAWDQVIAAEHHDGGFTALLKSREFSEKLFSIVCQLASPHASQQQYPIMLILNRVQVAGKYVIGCAGNRGEDVFDPVFEDFHVGCLGRRVELPFSVRRDEAPVWVDVRDWRFAYVPEQQVAGISLRLLSHELSYGHASSGVPGTRSHVLGRIGDAFWDYHCRAVIPLPLSRPRYSPSTVSNGGNGGRVLQYYDVFHIAAIRLEPRWSLCRRIDESVRHAICHRWAIAVDPVDPEEQAVVNMSTMRLTYEALEKTTCMLADAVQDAFTKISRVR